MTPVMWVAYVTTVTPAALVASVAQVERKCFGAEVEDGEVQLERLWHEMQAAISDNTAFRRVQVRCGPANW